jgi:hypothetical protein
MKTTLFASLLLASTVLAVRAGRPSRAVWLSSNQAIGKVPG